RPSGAHGSCSRPLGRLSRQRRSPKGLQKEDSIMSEGARPALKAHIVKAEGEEPLLKADDNVKITTRSPLGHFRVPNYIRGKRGRVEVVIEPPAVNNEGEGFGLNAGVKRHYYRLAIPLTELWSKYPGFPKRWAP